MTFPAELPDFARTCINLAQPRLGAEVTAVTDEFFAHRARMLDPKPAVFIADKYDDHGKWMDGWETRRRRGGGHDHAVIRLGVPGIIKGFDIDTRHFTGNYPPAASIEACRIEGDPDAATAWTEILPPSPLGPDQSHFFAIEDDRVWSHLRLHIYPDGGVARFRVYGLPHRDWRAAVGDEVDLAATINGGKAIAWNDAHYGHPDNILAPGRGVDMGDGWETRRRREPGHDWIIVRLGHPGEILTALVDTAHYKGNYPDRCSLQAAFIEEGAGKGEAAAGLEAMIVTRSMFWPVLMPEQKLEADAIHEFGTDVIERIGPVTHVRLNVHPDGGISRLRLFGRPKR